MCRLDKIFELIGIYKRTGMGHSYTLCLKSRYFCANQKLETTLYCLVSRNPSTCTCYEWSMLIILLSYYVMKSLPIIVFQWHQLTLQGIKCHHLQGTYQAVSWVYQVGSPIHRPLLVCSTQHWSSSSSWGPWWSILSSVYLIWNQ